MAIDLGPLGIVELSDELREREGKPIGFTLRTERREAAGMAGMAMAMDQANRLSAALIAALKRRFKDPSKLIDAMAQDGLFTQEELKMFGKSGMAFDARGGRRGAHDDDPDPKVAKRRGFAVERLRQLLGDGAKEKEISELLELLAAGGEDETTEAGVSEEDVQGRRGSPAAQDAPERFPGRPEVGGTMTPLNRNAGASGNASLDDSNRRHAGDAMSFNSGLALDAAGRKLAAQIGRRGSSSGRGFFERFKDAKRIGTF